MAPYTSVLAGSHLSGCEAYDCLPVDKQNNKTKSNTTFVEGSLHELECRKERI